MIVSTYNRSRFVREALDSVLRQSFKDLEVIVVDDGSSDNTPALLKAYSALIYYVYQKNRGRSAARNTGIRFARGEYLAFLDDDDLWLPGKLERQVGFLEAHSEIALAHTFTELMDENGRTLEKEAGKHLRSYLQAARLGYTYEGMSRMCVMYTSSVMLRKSCLDRVGLFDPGIEAFEDWDIYLRLALKYNIGTIPEPLVRIRVHPQHSTQGEFTRGRLKVALKHLNILESVDDPCLRERLRHNFYIHLARAYYIAKDTENSRGYTLRALSLNLPVFSRLNIGFNLLAAFLLPGLVNRLRGIKTVLTLPAKPQDYPQRIRPLETSGGPLASHMKRYQFAAGFCGDKVVLDAACGVGYGSRFLADIAREVAGVDISAEAVSYAQEHYQKENIHFRLMDVCNLEFPSGYFDIACSFETLEHLSQPLKFLAQIRRVLKEDGILIVSTPQVRRTVLKPKNPYHRVEFSRGDFSAALGRYFSRVEILGQRRRQSAAHYWIQKADVFHLRGLLPGLLRRKICHSVATRSWDEAGTEDFIISDKSMAWASELIAVCRK